MRKQNRHFGFERLESREMRAGDVVASLVNGDLYLTEAQAGLDNSVMISQQSNGKIRVAGNGTADNTVSKINGMSYQDFTVPGSLHINFGGGNDLVVIGSEISSQQPKFNAVDINVAAPLPVVVANAKTTNPALFPQGNDKDNVIIWGMGARGAVTINTGAGDDWVYVANTQIGDGVGSDDLVINTGSGADTAEVKNTQGILGGKIDIQTYSSLAENDQDTVWLEQAYAYGDISARTGGGNDLVHMFNTTSYKSIKTDAGTGDDLAEFNYACAVDSFMADLGDGNDTLNLTNLYTINGKTQLYGGAGTDHLNKSGSTPTSQLDQTGWEWVNGRPVGLITSVMVSNANQING